MQKASKIKYQPTDMKIFVYTDAYMNAYHEIKCAVKKRQLKKVPVFQRKHLLNVCT